MATHNPLARLFVGTLPLLIVWAALLTGACAANAATLNVPADYSTIQAAVDAASDGDTVLVAPGTYTAGADFEGKNITVMSSGGAAVTIVDASSLASPAFNFHSGESASAVLQGFYIENDSYSGITITDASPTIEQCIFYGDFVFGYGGAIHIKEISAACNPTVEQCLFVRNSTSGYGGAIECLADGSGGENVNIVNCAFDDNMAGTDGAAVDINSAVGPTSPTVNIVNCTFSDNMLSDPGSAAGGTIDNVGGAVTIVNCILWGDNTSTEYSTLDCPATTGGSLNIDHSDIEGGFAGTGAVDGGGNIDSDPLFVNAGVGDLRLLVYSPAINTGVAGGLVPLFDLDGNLRGAHPDMGAYQYVINVTNSVIDPTANVAFSGQVATFSDSTDLTLGLGYYGSALIDWGDGSPLGGGTISQPGGLGTPYVISGAHTYATAGPVTLTVSVSAFTLNLPYVTATGTSTITVARQILTSIAVTPGPALTVTGPATQQFTATALDQFGNPMSPQPTISWSLATASVGSLSTNGLYHSGKLQGDATVTARSGAVSVTAAVTVHAPVTVAVTAAATPNPVTGTTTKLSVLGGYEGSGGAGALTYTWSSTGPSAVTFSANGTTAARNTTATFTHAGSYAFTVTIAGPYGETATSSVDVTVNLTTASITVTPGPALIIGGPLPQTQQFNATAFDQFGNTMSPQPGISWALAAGSVGSVTSSGGLYRSGKVAGTATVEAKSGPATGMVTVYVDPPVTVVTAASANPNPVTGTTTSLSVLGGYAGTAGADLLTYTWSATGPGAVTYSVNGTNAAANTTATFTQSGSYTFTVTIASPYSSTTSSVTVTIDQTVTSITVSPGPTLTLGPPLPQTQQFTATALDQFGTALATQPVFTWSVASGGVGSITDTGGLYHSGTVAGSATVKAKSGTVMGTSVVTVN